MQCSVLVCSDVMHIDVSWCIVLVFLPMRVDVLMCVDVLVCCDF